MEIDELGGAVKCVEDILAAPSQGVPVLGFPSHRWSVGVLGDWGEVQEGFGGQLRCLFTRGEVYEGFGCQLGCWVTLARC